MNFKLFNYLQFGYKKPMLNLSIVNQIIKKNYKFKKKKKHWDKNKENKSKDKNNNKDKDKFKSKDQDKNKDNLNHYHLDHIILQILTNFNNYNKIMV